MNDSDSAWIFLGYLGPSISSKDYPAMEVLELIIGGGMNSRMWINLREKKGLAYDLGAFVNPTIGNGHMVTYIVTDPGKVQEVKKAILYEVEDMRKGKFTAEELDTMKNFRIGQYYINEETVKNQAFNLGLYETLGVGYEFYLKYPELIQNITKEDICRVAKDYLDNPVIIVLSPRKSDL
jgi:predicted Zn-dependent peptidase